MSIRPARRIFLSSLVALTLTASTALATSSQPNHSSPWWQVAKCEEGGHNSPSYGYLGIYPSTWTDPKYDGQRFAPVAGKATWSQQVTVAREIEAKAGLAGFVPDQLGCGHGW